MKKILVIYYTQSGQLSDAIKSTLAPIEASELVDIRYEQIQPKKPYPFPWTYMQFFNVFPESVQGKPCELFPFTFNETDKFDLIIIAYQPWFLSVSIPINSFLQTPNAKTLLRNQNVVTIIACRNMWLNAQEKMKISLRYLEANLTGNIVYTDEAPNLISLITVLAFVLGGVKHKFLGIFPKYGVSEKVLKESAPLFGDVVLKNILSGKFNHQQSELNSLGAVKIKSNLLLMEGRGKVLFPLYANYISKKGSAGTDDRNMRVRIFGIALPLGILILSPFITIFSRLAPLVQKKKFRKEIEYYSDLKLR